MLARRVRLSTAVASLLSACLIVSAGCDDGNGPPSGDTGRGVVNHNTTPAVPATKGKGEAKAVKSGDPQDLIPTKAR